MTSSLLLQWLLTGLFVSVPVIYLVGRITWRLSRGRVQPAGWLALLVFFAAWVPYILIVREVQAGQVPQLTLGMIHLEMDGVGLLMAGLVLLLGTLVNLYSIPYLQSEPEREKYFAMLIAISASMIGLCCARDIFNLWVWFEAMTITSYLLVVFHRNQAGALEAGLKYLVQSSVGSLFILVGISLVFARTGSLDLLDLPLALKGSGILAAAAGGMLLIGFGVKASLVPLHTWLPDAHSQAPSGVSAILSGLVIECGLIALLRVLGAFSLVSPAWGPLLLAFGVLNMLVGNLMALRQREVKRLLAYSSVAQVGYMLVGFGMAAAYGIGDGAAGGFFHILTHGVMKGLAFLAAGTLLFGIHIANQSHEPLVLDDLNGASRKYPFTAFAFSVAVLALAGFPPLAGFMSKWQIMAAGMSVRSTPALWLVIFMALNSVLSLAYYAPMVNRLYRREPSATVQAGQPAKLVMAVPLAILLLLTMIPGFWPSLVTWFTSGAGTALLRGFGF